jgi:iron complex transport system substrate-binding protein
LYTWLLLTALVGLPLACPAAAATVATAAAPRIVDDAGLRIALSRPANRIVSLSPGATAMLFAAGAGDRVVGTADFSDEPVAARAIPRIGDSQGYDLERIISLRPDVVVVWSGGTNAAQIELLQRAGLTVYRHRVQRLDDVPAAVGRFGILAGATDSANTAARDLAARIARLRASGRQSPPRSVLLQVWDQPVYTVGGAQLLTDALASCGYRNVFGDLRDAGPAVTLESVLARDPDIIVAVAPDVDSANRWLQRWRQYPVLSATRSGRMLALTDQRFSRLGPEAIAASEALCARLDALR